MVTIMIPESGRIRTERIPRSELQRASRECAQQEAAFRAGLRENTEWLYHNQALRFDRPQPPVEHPMCVRRECESVAWVIITAPRPRDDVRGFNDVRLLLRGP